MAQKVKCVKCESMMNWALPIKVTDENIDYARQCLSYARRTMVCGHTMKIKRRNHEQYCKHYKKSQFDNSYQGEIENLERMIAEYELQKEGGANDSTRSD